MRTDCHSVFALEHISFLHSHVDSAQCFPSHSTINNVVVFVQNCCVYLEFE